MNIRFQPNMNIDKLRNPFCIVRFRSPYYQSATSRWYFIEWMYWFATKDGRFECLYLSIIVSKL